MSPACPVFGFLVHLRPQPGVDASELELRLAEFLATKALVANGVIPTLLVSGESMQATEADRDVVREWLAGRSEIAHASIGPLGDIGSSA